MATYTPQDNFQSRVVVELARFRAWAGATPELYLGEFGLPNNKGGNQAQWNALGELAHARASKDRLHLTSWATGHYWGTGYNLAIYENGGGSWYGETNVAPFENSYGRSGLFTGINYAGPEFAHSDTIENPSTSFQPAYPRDADVAYLAGRGVEILRIPIRWERIASSLSGALRAGEVAALRGALDACFNNDVHAIIDVHNYAICHTNSGDVKTIAGTAGGNHLIDLLKRLADEFGGHGAFYALDIMNEPANVTWQQWEAMSQAAVTAIRNHGFTGRLMIPLGNYSGVQDLTFMHSGGPWITDTADNFMYEGHHYWQANHTGTYGESYSQEVNNAISFAGQGGFTWDNTTTGDYSPLGTGDGDINPNSIAPATTIGSPTLTGGATPGGGSSGEVEHDNTTTSSPASGYVNSTTVSHTATGDDLCAVVTIGHRYLTNKITSVKYDGVEMTQVTDAVNENVSGVTQYYLAGVPTGSSDVVVLTGTDYVLTQVAVSTYTGVNQTTPTEDATNGTAGFSTSGSISLTPTDDGAMAVGAIALKDDYALTPQASMTERADYSHDDANLGQLGVADRAMATAAATTVGFSWGTANNFIAVGFVLAPEPVAAVDTIAVSSIGSQTSIGSPTLTDTSVNNNPISAFQDDFSDGLAPADWANNSGGNIAVVGGQLVLNKPLGALYVSIRSVNTYDLTSSKVGIEIITAGAQTSPEYQLMPLGLQNDSDTTGLFIRITNNQLQAFKRVASSDAYLGQGTYNAATDKFLRIRHESGTIYFEKSADNMAWTSFFSIATPAGIDITALAVKFQVGSYASTPINQAKLDNLNIVIGQDQTINIQGFDNTESFGVPALYEDGIIRIESGIDNTPDIGTITIGDNSLKIIEQTKISNITQIGKPSITGELAANDTAPSYNYYRLAHLPIRTVIGKLYISWNRAYDGAANFFEYNSSAYDGGDVYRGDGSTIQEWDKFDYEDYSPFIKHIEYVQEQDILGSLVLTFADFKLSNVLNTFDPYGESDIADNILTNRPFKAFIGFQGAQPYQVIVGQTDRMPEVDEVSANFHGIDFIGSFIEIELTTGRTYTSVTIDEVFDDILENDAGLSPTQYDLDTGENTHSFIHIPAGTTIGKAFRDLLDSESGRMYQANDGEILFKNATNKERATAIRIADERILSEGEPEEGDVINRVKINSDVREVQASKQIYPALKDGSLTEYEDFQPFEVAAGETVEKFYSFKNPVTSFTHPTKGSGVEANAASDGTGASRNSDLTFVADTEFTESVKYTFTNNGGTALHIVEVTIDGTPAEVVEEIRIDYSDATSIGKYGEQLKEINNDFFTDKTEAQDLAEAVVNQLKDPPSIRRAVIRGIPYLAAGDVIEYRDGNDYVVDRIFGVLGDGNGFNQEIRIRATS